MAQLFITVRDVFASVRFAVLLFSLLATTSVIGTLIPQGEPIDFYVEQYGEQLALLMKIFDLDAAYSSAWFRFLFFLLTLSLIVCTLNRLPRVLRLIRKGESPADPEKILRGKNTTVLTSERVDPKGAEAELRQLLVKSRWKVRAVPAEYGSLLVAEKGAWTRLGSSIVHASVLLILLGAQIGAVFGFKAYVRIPEGAETQVVYRRDEGQRPIDLPFSLRCDVFAMEYYDNGMPKEYRSDLAVLENDALKEKKSITVNDPLVYAGITFYQSSYEPVPGQYIVEVAKKSATGKADSAWKFLLAHKEKKNLDEAGAAFEILDTGQDGHGHGPYMVRFDDGAGAVEITAEDKRTVSLDRADAAYTFNVRQRFATGLQVVKDPGVFIVYAGFSMMLLGLYVSFFTSHRRLSVVIRGTGTTTTVAIDGHSNKNRYGLSKTIDGLAVDLLEKQTLGLRRS